MIILGDFLWYFSLFILIQSSVEKSFFFAAFVFVVNKRILRDFSIEMKKNSHPRRTCENALWVWGLFWVFQYSLHLGECFASAQFRLNNIEMFRWNLRKTPCSDDDDDDGKGGKFTQGKWLSINWKFSIFHSSSLIPFDSSWSQILPPPLMSLKIGSLNKKSFSRGKFPFNLFTLQRMLNLVKKYSAYFTEFQIMIFNLWIVRDLARQSRELFTWFRCIYSTIERRQLRLIYSQYSLANDLIELINLIEENFFVCHRCFCVFSSLSSRWKAVNFSLSTNWSLYFITSPFAHVSSLQ